MNKEKFKNIMQKRDYELTVKEDLDQASIDKIWEELTELLSEDINDTITFMKNEINEEEFINISEVFYEIADKTQSKEFIKALYEIAEKFPKETDDHFILRSIEFADEFIEDEESKEK